MSRARALWRGARKAPLLGSALIALDRLWWARTIRRARIVDLDVVAAQLGRRVSARRAVRLYVRDGFRSGFVLNPLLMERTVSRQLSDADRVPALYAYLVNDRARLQTSPNWDAVALAKSSPAALEDPAGPLGFMWRRARRDGRLDLGPADAPVSCRWADVVASVRQPPAASEPVPADLRLTCVIGAHEPDPDEALALAAHAAAAHRAAVDLVVTGDSADVGLQASLLTLWAPRIALRSARLADVDEPRAYPDGSAGLFRGSAADLDAPALDALVAASATGPVAALWLAVDGTVASAGTVLHDGRPMALLEAHPAEDARRLGSEVAVPFLAGPARAWPSGSTPRGPGRTLTRVEVIAPRRSTAEVLTGPDTDLEALLAPAGLAIESWERDRPVLRRIRPRATSDVPADLRWAIKTASPAGRAGESWGDTHFARGIAAALRRRGQDTVVDAFPARDRRSSYLDDVVLVLRGPHRIDPPPARTRILWIISHPDEITAEELQGFDVVYAASSQWARSAGARLGREILPLLQCTDVTRFRPSGAHRTNEIVFVGTARGIPRPAVVEPLKHGIPVRVYGPDWRGYIPASAIAAGGIPNDELPLRYETAGVVLNDHWPAMQREGFVSNRLFDVVASGGRAISDEVEGITEIFGDAVKTFTSVDQLVTMLEGELDSLFPDAAALARIGDDIRAAHSFDARAEALLGAAVAG